MTLASFNQYVWYAPLRVSRLGLAVVVAAHALLFFGLLRMPEIVAPTFPTVLSVSLLSATETTPVREAEPEIVPPQPKHVTRRPVPQPTRQPAPLVAASESPAPTTATVPPAPPVSATSIAAPMPVPVSTLPPRFDVDYLDNPKPFYPVISRRLGEQGRVVLRVRVDATGLPLDVQLQAGSGSARLDLSALETVRRWKFVPARLGDEPVAATVLVPIAFSLKD